MMGEGLWIALVACCVSFVVACLGTWMVLKVDRRWRLLDDPDERSSHRVPMPTAGGLGIIAGFWSGWGILSLAGDSILLFRVSPYALVVTGLVLLLLVVDDLLRPLRVGEKMFLLCLATGVWLCWGPHLEWVTLPGLGRVELGYWGWGLTIFWFLSMCNAYNFMDGIDGITSVQTVSVCCFALLCLWRLDVFGGEVALLMVATGGFLVFNAPPARIFMGDVGSTFLGFFLAAVGILGERIGLPVWLVVLFMGYYLFDTGYTLMRRMLRGENVLKAHRKHLYQRLDKLGWSHLKIDLWVLSINLILGAGGYMYLFVSRGWGLSLVALGGGLLIGETVWIERKDRSFA